MPFAYWCVLVAALLPLAVVAYAKAGPEGDNHHPRAGLDRLPPARQRAYAAHQNGYENFPFFAAAVIIAVTSGASQPALNALAAAYVLLRVLHAALYIGDVATARSFAYLAGLVVNIAIFVLPAFR
ncbi:MAPEG family protein [Phreatobacter sp. AB_2022a]|uniref:MAPEG family protein n=1 Tax=Phreatobacter sp. AB_2022a TaxID=3003134 RepID=UPI002286E558|nr:MAPEG family protein [Phreatobacter sp. AB_2022a]MCZ0734931.1 MAPEG family protein [Phreatobacter sp. AB_2022a]